MHLRSIDIDVKEDDASFPLNLPLVQQFARLELTSPVTIFIGENGSGKSTLLEALAIATGLPAIGGTDLQQDETLNEVRALAEHMKLVWDKKVHRGFFLRAEDFFNFTLRMAHLRAEMADLAAGFDEELSGYGRDLAKGVAEGQEREITRRYGENADARSHGESFLNLFEQRFVPQGLYIMDEPEAPLSPQRQLALMSMLKDMTENRSAQFVIATHSPILMGFPGALLIDVDTLPPAPVEFDDAEHVRLTRDFLNGREAFLRHL